MLEHLDKLKDEDRTQVETGLIALAESGFLEILGDELMHEAAAAMTEDESDEVIARRLRKANAGALLLSQLNGEATDLAEIRKKASLAEQDSEYVPVL